MTEYSSQDLFEYSNSNSVIGSRNTVRRRRRRRRCADDDETTTTTNLDDQSFSGSYGGQTVLSTSTCGDRRRLNKLYSSHGASDTRLTGDESSTISLMTARKTRQRSKRRAGRRKPGETSVVVDLISSSTVGSVHSLFGFTDKAKLWHTVTAGLVVFLLAVIPAYALILNVSVYVAAGHLVWTAAICTGAVVAVTGSHALRPEDLAAVDIQVLKARLNRGTRLRMAWSFLSVSVSLVAFPVIAWLKINEDSVLVLMAQVPVVAMVIFSFLFGNLLAVVIGAVDERTSYLGDRVANSSYKYRGSVYHFLEIMHIKAELFSRVGPALSIMVAGIYIDTAFALFAVYFPLLPADRVSPLWLGFAVCKCLIVFPIVLEVASIVGSNTRLSSHMAVVEAVRVASLSRTKYAPRLSALVAFDEAKKNLWRLKDIRSFHRLTVDHAQAQPRLFGMVASVATVGGVFAHYLTCLLLVVAAKS